MGDEYIKRVVASKKVERILTASEEIPDDSDCEILDQRMDLMDILDETIPENCFEIEQEKDIIKDELVNAHEAEQSLAASDITRAASGTSKFKGGNEQNGAKGDDSEFERY